MKEMNRNAAMMEWLDTVRNRKAIPNENYAPRAAGALHARRARPRADAAAQLHAGRHRADRARLHRLALRRPATAQAFLDEDQHDFNDDFPGRGPEGDLQADRRLRRRRARLRRPAARASRRSTASSTSSSSTATREGKNTVARRTAYRLLRVLRARQPVDDGFVDEVVDRLRLRRQLGHRRAAARRSSCHDDFYLTAAARRRIDAPAQEVGQVADRLRGQHAAAARA